MVPPEQAPIAPFTWAAGERFAVRLPTRCTAQLAPFQPRSVPDGLIHRPGRSNQHAQPDYAGSQLYKQCIKTRSFPVRLQSEKNDFIYLYF